MTQLRATLSCCVTIAFVVTGPRPARCQSTDPAPVTAEAYVPIAPAQRVDWIVDGTIGKRSLTVVGPLATAWQTAFDTPEEWGRGFSGIARRYAQREADVAISNTIEAGLGALWGEDPRYIPSGRKAIRPRPRYTLQTGFLSQL